VVDEAWYYQAACAPMRKRGGALENITHELLLEHRTLDGGCELELPIRWHGMGRHGPPAPRLELFQDSWDAFATWSDLFEAMAELNDPQSPPTPAAFRAMLEGLGFTDATERTRR
jgi:hypothetical protein